MQEEEEKKVFVNAIKRKNTNERLSMVIHKP